MSFWKVTRAGEFPGLAESRYCYRLQYARYTRAKGNERIQRSPFDSLEELHIRPVWCEEFPSHDVRRYCYEYTKAADNMA